MKSLKLISGILGILGAFISLYVMFISPAYVSIMYPLFAAIFLVGGSVLMIVSHKKATLGFAAGSFFIALVMYFFHVMNVSSEESSAGVSQLPDYIPDGMEIGGIILMLVAFILAVVSIFGKHENGK